MRDESVQHRTTGAVSVMRALCLTSLYPNQKQPRNGIFVEHRLHALAQDPSVDLRIVAPVPWLPEALGWSRRYRHFAGIPAREVRRGLTVSHPRYPTVPKLGMHAAPFLMAAALLPHLRRAEAEWGGFDVLDAHYLYPDGVAAALLGKALGKPVVLSAYGSDVSQLPRFPIPRHLIVRAVTAAHGVTTVCSALAQGLTKLGVPPERLTVILQGVDLELFQPAQDREDERRAANLAGQTIISVGHLIRRKGHDLAIEALALLPGVRLLIVGDGPEEGNLRRLAGACGVADRVTFLGHVDQSRLPALFSAADVTVNCSDREGLANVLLESLACGTPVAATAVWGSPELVTVPEAGTLFEERTPAAIAAGISMLLAAPPDRAATRRYAERFTWSAAARRHMAVLEGAVAGYEAIPRDVTSALPQPIGSAL